MAGSKIAQPLRGGEWQFTQGTEREFAKRRVWKNCNMFFMKKKQSVERAAVLDTCFQYGSKSMIRIQKYSTLIRAFPFSCQNSKS